MEAISNHNHRSPFEQQVLVDVADAPELFAIFDPHLMPPRGIENGSPASTKRLMLSWIEACSRLIASNDLASRVALSLASDTIAAAPNSTDALIYVGGDNIDTCSVPGFFHCLAQIELYCTRRYPAEDKDKKPLQTIVAMGNHDMAFRGPDNIVDYAGVPLPLIPNDIFQDLANLAQQGLSAQELNAVVRQIFPRSNETQYKLHPVQKWYLQKLIFGHEIGAFSFPVAGRPHRKELVAFLNSELESPGRSLADLQHVITNVLHLEEGDTVADETLAEDTVAKETVADETVVKKTVAQDMIATYQADVKRQEEVIAALFSENRGGEKRIVYTHNPVLMHKKLVQAFAPKFKGNKLLAKELLAQEWIANNLTIYGGHYHVPLENNGSVIKVAGASRQGAGVFVQKPSAHSPFGGDLGLNAFGDSGDRLELMVGKAHKPALFSITAEEIKAKLNRLKPKDPKFKERLRQTLLSVSYNFKYLPLRGLIAALG